MRYKIILSYNGRGYNGWQIQKDKNTIQAKVNEVISAVLRAPINVTASGRTDSDVSAIRQVAHFDYDGKLPTNFMGHCNSLLGDQISVLDVCVAPNFHARFDAKRKTYKYCFYDGRTRNAYFDTFAYFTKSVLNYKVMSQSIKYLTGTYNFTSFCASNTSVKDKVRTIYDCTLDYANGLYTLTITGNGFLYNMVRIIVGTLIMIGRGESPSDMADIIKSCDRKRAGKTVPAFPLVLVDVDYNNV